MTVVWHDEPGSELAGKNDVIDFSVDSDVVALSVSFERRAEERAYRDGAFLPPYEASTKDDAGRFALRRTGGWPSAPTVYVDEAKTTPWDVLYEIDFTAQPSQQFWGYLEGPIHEERIFTIDGLQWSVFNGTTSTYGQRLVQGTGVQLQADGRMWEPANTRFAGGASITLALSQFAGYDPARPTAVLCRVLGKPSGGGNHQAGAVLLSLAEMAAQSPYSFQQSYGVAAHFSGGSEVFQRFFASAPRIGGRPVPIAVDGVIGVAKTDAVFGYGLRGDWSDSFDTVESMEPVASGLTLRSGMPLMDAGFIVGTNGANDSNRWWTCTHMRVLQRQA